MLVHDILAAFARYCTGILVPSASAILPNPAALSLTTQSFELMALEQRVTVTLQSWRTHALRQVEPHRGGSGSYYQNAGPSSHASYRGGGGTSYRGGGGHSKPGGGNHNHKRARGYEGRQPRDSNRRDSGPNQGTGGGGGNPANVPGQGPGNTPN